MKSETERIRIGRAAQRTIADALLRANKDGLPARDAMLVLMNLQRELLKKIPGNERSDWIEDVIIPHLRGNRVGPKAGPLVRLH